MRVPAGPSTARPGPPQEPADGAGVGVASPFCPFSCSLRGGSGQLRLGKAKKPHQVRYLISAPDSLTSGAWTHLGANLVQSFLLQGGKLRTKKAC